MITKYNHEFELKDGRRILDPIGKMSFNEQVVATKDGNVHTIDLEKSSNFIVKITDNDSWIEFVNYSGIHRFDIVIQITGDIFVESIKFGNGTKEYYQPQTDIGTLEDTNTILPYLFWPYNLIPIRAIGRGLNDVSVLTVRFGTNLLGAELVNSFNIVSYKWFTNTFISNTNTLTINKFSQMSQEAYIVNTLNGIEVSHGHTGSIAAGTELTIDTYLLFGSPFMVFQKWAASEYNIVPPYTGGFDNHLQDSTTFNMPADNVTITSEWS